MAFSKLKLGYGGQLVKPPLMSKIGDALPRWPFTIKASVCVRSCRASQSKICAWGKIGKTTSFENNENYDDDHLSDDVYFHAS